MYTILLNTSGALTTSRAETIMQKSTGNSVKFIIPISYMGQDLSTLSCYLKYVMPVSKNMRMKELTFTAMNGYEDEYLESTLDADANFTSQAGDIEISLSFIGTTLNNDDTITSEVAKTQAGYIHITPIAVFEEYVPDELLNEVDQRIIATINQIKELNALADSIYNSTARDIAIENEKTLKVTDANGDFIGDGVAISNISSIVKTDLVGKETDDVEDGVSDLDATDLG